MKAALAFLMWGGQVIVCSTHNGSENEFNLQVQEILGQRSKFMHMRIDFDEALQEGLYQRICLVTGVEWTPEGEAQWRQDIIDFYGDGADEELFCVPSMGSGAWLSAPLIEARMNSDGPVLRLELPPDYLHRPAAERARLISPFMEELDEALDGLDAEDMHAFGFDFARVSDLSVGPLLALTRKMKRRLALTVEMRRVPGDEQKQVCRMILKRSPRLLGAAFDAVGMGWIVAEDMGREFGLYDPTHNPSGLVRAIQLTEAWYRTEMPPLKVWFEDDAIDISRDAEHLTDLRMVKVIRGTPRVPDLRTGEAGKKRHGDFAIGLGLAGYASRQQWHEYAYQPVPLPRSRFEERPSTDRDGGEWRDRADERTGRFRMASTRNGGIF